jgi:hypothetical protein
MIGVLGAAWTIARKFLVVEARSRELVYTTLFFGIRPTNPILDDRDVTACRDQARC